MQAWLVVICDDYNYSPATKGKMSTTPAWVDFVVVIGLCLFLWRLLQALRRITANMRKKSQERIDLAIQTRKKISDPFRNTNGYGYDYCMVFKVIPMSQKLSEKQKEFSLKNIINKLADAGIQTKMFYSVQNDEVLYFQTV